MFGACIYTPFFVTVAQNIYLHKLYGLDLTFVDDLEIEVLHYHNDKHELT